MRAEALADPRSTDELVQMALTMPDDETTDEEWEASRRALGAVDILQRRGTRQVLGTAKRLCQSQNSDERFIGVVVLGQLRYSSRCYRRQRINGLLRLLRRESEPTGLKAIGVAFGHLTTRKAVPMLRRLRHHPASNVRFGVVCGLTGLDDKQAIRTLVELTY